MTQVRPLNMKITFKTIVKVVSLYYTGSSKNFYKRVGTLLEELGYTWPEFMNAKHFVDVNKRIVKSLFETIPAKRTYGK